MPGIIGTKVGMTTVYNADGKALPCTIIQAGPCVVTQVKTEQTDGYTALQLAFGDAKTNAKQFNFRTQMRTKDAIGVRAIA